MKKLLDVCEADTGGIMEYAIRQSAALVRAEVEVLCDRKAEDGSAFSLTRRYEWQPQWNILRSDFTDEQGLSNDGGL
jgi:hypothetical protein